MAGLNSTGLPNTNDYNLGRGVVYFSGLSNGLPDASGYRDLGNAPEFNVSVETEDLEHQSSRQGLRITDKRFVISQTVNLTLTLDELNFDNLALFMSGSTGTYDNPHDTTWTGHENAILSSSVVLGRWYDLVDDNGARVYDLNAAGLVYSFESDPAGTPTTLVLDTDYTLDLVMGRIFLLSGATNIAAGDTLGWEISTGASVAQDLDEVAALQLGTISGAMKFIAENPGDSDKQTEYQFHQVSLSAAGDLALIGDEVITMQLEGTAEANNNVADTSKTLTVRTFDTQP